MENIQYPSASIKFVRLSYLIAPHILNQGVGEEWASKIVVSYNLSPGRLRTPQTEVRLSAEHHGMPLNVLVDSGSNPRKSVYDMVSAVNNAWQLDVSTEFQVICFPRFVVTLCL